MNIIGLIVLFILGCMLLGPLISVLFVAFLLIGAIKLLLWWLDQAKLPDQNAEDETQKVPPPKR